MHKANQYEELQAFSDMPAWLAMKAATIASERRIPGPIAVQVEYSLVARDIESEHIPVAREAGMGVMPWSPLAGGFLSGKYSRENTKDKGRLSGPNPFGDSKFVDRNWAILDVLKSVSAEQNRPLAQVALRWVMARPGVTSTIVGASKLMQLASNIAATEIVLSESQMKRLNEVSAPVVGFSAGLATPMIRSMVFGGNTVAGWME
ncbi:aldo/keto reductase [uncultured Caballeronia sp.]|uniref:aldo/keto reductase n=1 Tax=uncultured Caballeronia sp. TaxID=1827198 RepID=UPI001575A061